jgi:pilus assembly protein Flp/PilA
MLEHIKAFLKDEEGASAVEYGLIVGLIAVAIIAVLLLMGEGLTSLFTEAQTEITGAVPGEGGG